MNIPRRDDPDDLHNMTGMDWQTIAYHIDTQATTQYRAMETNIAELKARLEKVRIACVHAESPYGNGDIHASLLRQAIGPDPKP